MVFLLYSFVSLFVFVYFMKYQKKHLHALEIFLFWCLASLLIQIRSAIFTMNMKSVVIPQSLLFEFSHVLIRLVLYPLVTVFCLNEIAATASKTKKIGMIIKYSALLLGLEWISDWLGVFNHMKPYLLGSGVFWVGYVMLMIMIMKVFHRKFYEGYHKP
ncbi:hypothetical protein PAECIP111891_03921 [Paenibacillus allorhizoplanae]|uniref:Uncharacterized protein n=1 Tax=Paenibacillus allorhizoplanae TaxID=2905648 RepID=A0ABM9CHA5_9BACL|nr:hypothetical protein [Paenibacillus allorhizoplanae]CAH1213154.1 hypothetical protein PAECIP111891_03921 [Paenibacillus allorhizoplanae]